MIGTRPEKKDLGLVQPSKFFCTVTKPQSTFRRLINNQFRVWNRFPASPKSPASLTGRDHVAIDDFPDPRVEADLSRRQDGHVVLVDDPSLQTRTKKNCLFGQKLI